jgi:hypothetical protein
MDGRPATQRLTDSESRVALIRREEFERDVDRSLRIGRFGGSNAVMPVRSSRTTASRSHSANMARTAEGSLYLCARVSGSLRGLETQAGTRTGLRERTASRSGPMSGQRCSYPRRLSRK